MEIIKSYIKLTPFPKYDPKSLQFEMGEVSPLRGRVKAFTTSVDFSLVGQQFDIVHCVETDEGTQETVIATATIRKVRFKKTMTDYYEVDIEFSDEIEDWQTKIVSYDFFDNEMGYPPSEIAAEIELDLDGWTIDF